MQAVDDAVRFDADGSKIIATKTALMASIEKTRQSYSLLV